MAQFAAFIPLISGALSLIGNLTKKEPREAAAPAAPATEPVEQLPGPDDEAVKRRQRQSIAAQRARRGRAATQLTQGVGTSAGTGTLGAG